MDYIISDYKNPSNHRIYAQDKELGSCILHLVADDNNFQPKISKKQNLQVINEQNLEAGRIQKLYVDGASSQGGSGAGVVIISPTQQVVTLSYKLQSVTTNNTAEYEALVLGMKATKDLGVEQLVVFGDSKLVVQQVRDNYQVKNSKLKKLQK